MSFSKALEALENGRTIRRSSWKEDIWIALVVDGMKRKLTVNDKTGSFDWDVKQDDILARDWVTCG